MASLARDAKIPSGFASGRGGADSERRILPARLQRCIWVGMLESNAVGTHGGTPGGRVLERGRGGRLQPFDALERGVTRPKLASAHA